MCNLICSSTLLLLLSKLILIIRIFLKNEDDDGDYWQKSACKEYIIKKNILQNKERNKKHCVTHLIIHSKKNIF